MGCQRKEIPALGFGFLKYLQPGRLARRPYTSLNLLRLPLTRLGGAFSAGVRGYWETAGLPWSRRENASIAPPRGSPAPLAGFGADPKCALYPRGKGLVQTSTGLVFLESRPKARFPPEAPAGTSPTHYPPAYVASPARECAPRCHNDSDFLLSFFAGSPQWPAWGRCDARARGFAQLALEGGGRKRGQAGAWGRQRRKGV